ncbi:MAG TPA: hypothetical protein VHQ90_10280 [Thermoanaerobaculia bacterium]|nr:hypothetical protein [Thermoanaerobaculia bacterium]
MVLPDVVSLEVLLGVVLLGGVSAAVLDGVSVVVLGCVAVAGVFPVSATRPGATLPGLGWSLVASNGFLFTVDPGALVIGLCASAATANTSNVARITSDKDVLRMGYSSL